jgi:transposase
MLQITPHHRLRLAVKPADFRRGIDGLAALCRQSLNEDPFNGTIFIFTNRSKKAVKILVFDGNGFWLCAKRFSRGRLAWWPTQNLATLSLNPSQLHILLAQGNPMDTSIPPDWRPLLPTPLDAAKGENGQTAQAPLCMSTAANLLVT